jgi:hypothetical protein
MNETRKPHNEIERLLKQAHPSPPSDELKERVLLAAKKAWAAHPNHTLHRIALRRLVLSAAAAVLIVVLADAWSNATMARWQSLGPDRIALVPDDRPHAERHWAEIPHHSLIGRIATAGRPTATDGGALLDYTRKLQEALSQTDPI